MKKIYLAVFLACSMGGAVQAQISEGGLPWSIKMKTAALNDQAISKAAFDQPDYAKLLIEDEADAKAGIAKAYRVAATVPTNLDLGNSGTWTYLDDGSKVWRLQIEVPNAKALSLYYDKFNFPKGVKLYVSNENKRQILGAYSEINNSQYDIFSSHEVQGNLSTLELNVPKGVSVADIKFHISKVYAYYRGVDDVKFFADLTEGEAKPTIDESSSCHINANCDPSEEPQFKKAKNATVRIFGNGGFCSGTLVNSKGNATGGNCVPYLLTASHCDDANSRDNAHFAGLEFRFNYQYSLCSGAPLQAFQTIVGADFVARSNLPSIANSGNAYVADFLLLKVTSSIPASADAYLAGWNRNLGIWNDENYDRYIGFHHPAGDLKKMSYGTSIFATGKFNQQVVANTHWDITFASGGTSPGSSGSGLFDKDGLIIGDLSGGPDGNCGGKEFGGSGLYSKIAYTWENQFDQTAFPAFAGSKSRLKDWLDPNNSGIVSMGPTKYNCSDMPTDINTMESRLDNSIFIYPNPSTTDKVHMKFNFAEVTDLSVDVMDIRGAKISGYKISKVQSGDYIINLNSLSNGMYLLKFVTGDNVTVTKKVLLSK